MFAHSSLVPLRQGMQEIIARCHKLIRGVYDPYRPELYYMRGPGPKWHAKHSGQAAGSAA